MKPNFIKNISKQEVFDIHSQGFQTLWLIGQLGTVTRRMLGFLKWLCIRCLIGSVQGGSHTFCQPIPFDLKYLLEVPV